MLNINEIAKSYKTELLQKEYNKYSRYFFDFQKHIELCLQELIITTTERNNLLKSLNDVIRLLNTIYNMRVLDSFDNVNDIHDVCSDSNTVLDVMQLYGTLRIQDTNCTVFTSFNTAFREINVMIQNKIASKIGFPNLSMALRIIIGSKYKWVFNKQTTNTIKLLNKIFVPLHFRIEKLDDQRLIFVEGSNFKKDVLIQNCVSIYVKKVSSRKRYIVLTGYFVSDALNIVIRTSQICFGFIHAKKKEFEDYVVSKGEVSEGFIKGYIRNIDLYDIFVLSKDEFLAKITKDYILYQRLIKLPFMILIKEFNKEDDEIGGCLRNMFWIIKLLLMGGEDSINVAGLLFSISKEKGRVASGGESEFCIADIIYKNLSYVLQIKLKKTGSNIKKELDRVRLMTSDDVDLKKQVVVCVGMPDYVKKAAFEKIEEMKTVNNEYYKQLLYVKTLLNFPWSGSDVFLEVGRSKEKSRIFLDKVIDGLDRRVYGHKDCKEVVKELIGKWLCNPNSSGSSIGLMGPPGVGKTLLAKAVGEVLEIPFVQITLGGQNDGDLLHGHGYTYSGSQPGLIIKKMVEAGNPRCIMYFDELDKACKKYDTNEIFNILIHITDPNMNNEFQDRFFQEIKFPLNKVLFIFSYNDSTAIDGVLMDRIQEIEVKPFKLQDKKNIVEHFLVKEMCQMVGLDVGKVKFSSEAVNCIIEQYTNEPGIRELKRKFEKIFLKLNIKRIYGDDGDVVVDRADIEKYLGMEVIHLQCVEDAGNGGRIGVINGLFATDRGQGGIMTIEICNKFTKDGINLKLTGSQKKVMRESVFTAYTTAMNFIDNNIVEEYVKKFPCGFHVNVPSLATPKDGPSAAIAFTVAFISKILGKQVRNDIAMTGEIELTGKISRVGGLQYKLMGAKRAGVKLVLLPFENKYDIEQIQKEYPELCDDTFKVVLVNDLSQVLPHVFVNH